VRFGVQLFFDQVTDESVRDVWRVLAERKLASYLHQSANRPHITLVEYEDAPTGDVEHEVQAFAADAVAFPVTFVNLGFFPPTANGVQHEGVAFCAPVVTRHLLQFQARVYNQLSAISRAPVPVCLPGRWVPHCSLATHFPAHLISEVLELSRALPLPLTGEVTAIGIVELHPAKPLATHEVQSPTP
jgi:2'-5' RNA ligase